MSFGFSVGDFIAAIELANKIRKEFVNAPSQFKAIADEVRSLSIVLQDADVAFPERELNNDQKRDLEDIDNGCRNILDELQRILDINSELSSETGSVGRRIKRVWKRLKWDPEEIKELRSRISTNISLLNALNGRLTRDNVVKLVRHQEDQGRETVLDWLTPIDYTPQQHDFISRRQAGTGQWLLNSTEFQTWLNTDKQTMFCPGIPGAGKTILAAVVIDELTTRFSNDPTIGIAYIYCNFRRHDEQKIDDLLASLLKQLAICQPSLPDSVKDLYDRHKTKRTLPLLDEISTSLQSVLTTYSRVFIIIDALDECQVSDGNRIRFLSEICSLQAKCGANLLVTSRFMPDITVRFNQAITLEIRASSEDVRRYLDGHMFRLPGFVVRSPELQEEVKSKIVQSVQGMFLLAQLHLDSLIGKRSAKVVRNALAKLPTGSEAYDHAYKDAMDRIEGQVNEQQGLAKQVLSWITCAKRPLTILELQHALGVEVGNPELDKDNLPEIEDMVSVCAGLVTIDEESNIIRLVHYTTQEYFERNQSHWFPSAESEIATACITYLLFNIFKSDAFAVQTANSDEKLLELFSKYPLLPYAARYWGYHSCLSPENNIADMILDFLKQAPKLAYSVIHSLTYRFGASGRRTVTDVPELQIAASFGLKDIVKVLLEGGADIEARSSDGWTALSSAAWNGQEAVIELLLEHGANIEAKNDAGWNALANACRNQHLDVVRELLARGADIETKTNDGWTPLLNAAWHGHESIVRLLLEKGANIEAKNDAEWTSLHQVSWHGDRILTKLLLDNGASVDARTKYGRRPLMAAARTRTSDEHTVQLLLQAGSDKAARDAQGETALHLAAGGGHEAVVRVLLENGADLALKNYFGIPVLHSAARNGHKAVVQLLLENGADIEAKSESGGTALHWAADGDHDTVVQLLLEKGANVEAKDNRGETALQSAATYGHNNVVRLLIEKGADLEAKTNKGETALQQAAGNGHEVVVRQLLEHNSDDASYKKRIATAQLYQASMESDAAAMQQLIDDGADLKAKDISGETASDRAARFKYVAVMQVLLQSEVDASVKE